MHGILACGSTFSEAEYQNSFSRAAAHQSLELSITPLLPTIAFISKKRKSTLKIVDSCIDGKEKFQWELSACMPERGLQNVWLS